MRAFVVVLPLFVAAALLAACGSNTQTRSNHGTARFTAKVGSAVIAPTRKRAHKSPYQALLKREPPPQCALSKPPEDIPSNEARVVMLDYERQCYRQSAEIARAKIDALQNAAAGTRAHKLRDQEFLKREPSVQCEASRQPEGIPSNEGSVVTLDYERQCYRTIAETEQVILNALQDAVGSIKNHTAHKRRARHRVFHYVRTSHRAARPVQNVRNAVP
jgi:hypothetical protein